MTSFPPSGLTAASRQSAALPLTSAPPAEAFGVASRNIIKKTTQLPHNSPRRATPPEVLKSGQRAQTSERHTSALASGTAVTLASAMASKAACG